MDKAKEMVTIFQETIVPEFVIRLKDGEDIPKRAPTRSNTFSMMLSSKSDKLTKFWLELIDGRIYMRNAQENPVLAYIDIAYSRIKLLKSAEMFGKTLNGIRFIKAKNYEEIFHPDLATILDWFEVLKRYCVMSKFREIYQIKNMIGKGNFAKVFVTTRIKDQKPFAAKIFDKKLIVQDKFERVSFCKQECLLYELKMMREVWHPNLLSISEIYEGDNNIYCLGRLYSGESLSSLIQDKKRVIPQEAVYMLAGRMLEVGSD